MDYQQQNVASNAAENQSGQGKRRKRGTFRRVFWGIFTVLSVLVNIVLILAVIGLVGFYTVGGGGAGLMEKVVTEGDAENKVAMINLKGIIDEENTAKFEKQLERAKKDKAVKGIIVLTNSPGGSVSASDRIYNEINKYKADTNEPAVAFMQRVAASGGYYTSVACDKIIAEPTAVTGSIGVVTAYAVVQELLEDKLGITPVVITAGEKKDWPSSFAPPSKEQKEYLDERVVQPAYKRFKQVITESRQPLTAQDVNELADGSIYFAPQALEVELIDEVGYFDKAVSLVSEMAGIENPQVVEYQQPFSVKDMFGSPLGKVLNLDTAKVFELATPKVMYLWTM